MRQRAGEPPETISGQDVFARLNVRNAIVAVQHALRDGLDPTKDHRRSVVELERGQLLLMPAESDEFVGVKIVSVAPGNPTRAKERIQGVYVLMDAATLTPVALIDGAALTTLRTSAVSGAIAEHLAPAAPVHLVVFGSGPQAEGHVEAMRVIRTLTRVTIVGRDRDRAAALASLIQASGLDAEIGTSDDVKDAGLIVCATTARAPLFDGDTVPADSLTIAVGSHEPDAREIDSALIARAQVVVEEVRLALGESGDLVIPLREGVIDGSSLVAMRQIMTGTKLVDRGRPRVFKSSGMSWEDLVIATEVYRARRS